MPRKLGQLADKLASIRRLSTILMKARGTSVARFTRSTNSSISRGRGKGWSYPWSGIRRRLKEGQGRDVDSEVVLWWRTLTQEHLDEEWCCMANGGEGEVLGTCSENKVLSCQYEGEEPIQWVCKKVGQDDRTGKGLEGKEFLAASLTQCNRVSKKLRASDRFPVRRKMEKRSLLSLVNKVDNLYIRQEARRILREDHVEEFEEYLEQMKQVAEQQRKDRRQASHSKSAQKPVQSAEGGAKM